MTCSFSLFLILLVNNKLSAELEEMKKTFSQIASDSEVSCKTTGNKK